MTETYEQISHEPSPFENYVEKEYLWRAGKNYLLKKATKKYTLQGEFLTDEDYVSIARNIIPDSCHLQKGGEYMWYDKELLTQYQNQQCTVQDIWNYRGNGYQKLKSQ